jgi:hypothetical protein
MYKLARMLVGLEIQSVAQEWIKAWSGPNGNIPPNFQSLYRVDPAVRFNSGLTLESALLFNFPILQPDAFASRAARVNQSLCDSPVTYPEDDIGYLNQFPVNFGKYVQGATESVTFYTNGVRNGNRGNGDIIAILIRRGREMGLPSFTDIRESATLSPSGCQWNSWDGTGKCDPAKLFKASALPALRTLYNTPGDVELIVGASLSVERVPQTPGVNLFKSFIDATQAYLVLGEIDRIINLDVFGVSKCLVGVDTFFSRFRYDDPGTLSDFSDLQPPPMNGFSFSEGTVRKSKQTKAQGLVQNNSKNKCMPAKSFHMAGFLATNGSPNGFTNLFNLPVVLPLPEGSSGGKYFNCDIPETVMDTYTDGGGTPYTDLYCFGDPEGPQCWKPELPYCV